MTHAWLDSLSEDWPSQNGLEPSPPQLPALKHDENSTTSTTNDAREPESRLPLPVTKTRHANSNARDSSPNVLSERSSNEKIVPSSVHNPSKLSQEIKITDKSRQTSRTISASTTGSVVHNTVQHNSQQLEGSSPKKDHGQTPEWKRRLVYGEVAYGEQRDLFSSAAAAGLENIFKPPTAQEISRLEPVDEHDSTLASSPPPLAAPSAPQAPMSESGDWDEPEEDEEASLAHAHEGSPSPSPRRPRGVTYKMMDDSVDQSRSSDFATHQDNRVQDGTAENGAAGPTSLMPPSDASRKTSGQSVVRNEDFSPILLSCRKGNSGELAFAPEIPADLLKQRLENLRINQIRLESYSEQRLDVYDQQGSDPTGNETTGDLVRRGEFANVNMQRGGRSNEGSFKHRPLSPGFTVDTSEMLPEESLQASTPKQFPTLRINEQGTQRFPSQSPPQLRVPFPSPEKQGTQPQASGGSPLKLFGPYDTFTNQTLLRRISQFEDHSSNSSRQSFHPNGPVTHPRQGTDSAAPSSRSVSQFGHGDLEGFQFDEDLSIHHQHGGRLVENYEEGSSELEDSISLHRGDASPSDERRMSVPKRRQDSSGTSAASRPAGGHLTSSHSGFNAHSQRRLASGPDILPTPKRDAGSEGKRPRTSPSKDPTPKRRRTLHKSDVAYGRDQQLGAVESVQDVHFSMQSMMRKENEGSGGLQELAPPDVLSLRHVMRPRTPTPSQRSSMQRERHPSHEIYPEEHQKPSSRSSQLATSVNQQSHFTETERKPSIRTQDFVDQAGAIMAMIRSGAKPPSGLTSVEESEGENASPGLAAEESSHDDSTREPFSRPPSRDGKPVTRTAQKQEDPEILDHLNKYREVSDMGDIVSSIRTSGEVHDVAGASGGEGQANTHQGPYPSTLDGLLDDSEVVSDPPNIRISHGPISEHDGPGADFPSNSSGSTGRSLPTGSSRGSDSRKMIAPQSVSHLIPDQVGSMYLDRDQNLWVKRKGGSVRVTNVLPSEDSEEDPFKSIPDLSVDLTKEMQHLRLGASQRTVSGEDRGAPSSPSSCTPQSQQSKSYVTLSPNEAIPEGMASQARDELTKLESRDGAGSDQGGDTQEMKVEDRLNRNTPSKKNLTISFSSPIASVIHDMSMEDIDSLEDDAGVIPRPAAQPQSERAPRNRYPSLVSPAKKKMQNRSKSMPRGPSRHRSVHGQAFIPRPVSRIDEQDEENAEQKAYDESRQVSIIGDTSVVSQAADNRHGSLSFILSTPGVPSEAGGVISQNVGNMSLSPMSEFTMNNKQDQSFGFEVSYIVDKHHLVTGDGSKRVLSMTVRDLVDRLTEVEPFEPNWDDFQELDVSDKRLSSLHMLDEFCGRLVTLDASNNSLAHLDGVPSTVRELKMTNNMLTEITSWHHLFNLQYLDVSNNELQSLAALGSLVHLRSVKADNNKLTSLDGLMFHDGLLSLRARNNLIEALDFDSNKLDRLAELDLGGNEIREINNLGQLGSLETLKLQRNALAEFGAEEPLSLLRYLDLGDNGLTTLDITYMPGLRLLHSDRNRLCKITGFGRARHLDSISLREQKGDGKLDLSFLSAAYEIRKLFLSGNYLGEFEPKVDFLNLQLLELANCGLHRLPRDMGQLMPNLRSLNLNFNALADVGAIRFIPRLKKLLAAGNRLSDSTHVTTILTEFPHLTRLDLRGNPVTLGFYPPVQVMVPVDREGYVDPFVMPEADAERDEQFRGRLDEATRLRRRLYQMAFAGCCKRLRVLDGLGVERKAVLARDAAFDKLVGEGLLPRGVDESLPQRPPPPPPPVERDDCGGREEEPGKDGVDSSRWNAEDSFA